MDPLVQSSEAKYSLQVKIFEFYPSGGTMVKYRIGIYGRRAAKTGKKSWRETWRTTGAKFRSKILSPGENFTHLVAPQSSTESEFLGVGRPKRLKSPGEKLDALLVKCSKGKYSLQVKIIEFYLFGLKCRRGTPQSAKSCRVPAIPDGTPELCTSGA